MIGTILGGRYRIVHKVGEGATSEIWLAEHMHIGRHEAIKVLRPEVAAEQTFVSRFRREARAINRVQHNNIIGIFDFGQLPDGRLYLAMEYGNGRTVDHVLRDEGLFPVPRALSVLHQLASAVTHAHGHHVVHRDLKPANLMLVEQRGQIDVLKVLDFGMAKILVAEGDDQLTRQGQIFGTPEYMAPEQATGVTDPRCDIYSIGCIALELLTGRPPFSGHRIQQVQQHMESPPPLASSLNSNVPFVLDAIIARCLDKDPAKRFQSGAQLAAALEQVPGFAKHKPTTRTGRFMQAVTLPPIESDHELTHDSAPHHNVKEFQQRLGHADTATAAAMDVRDELYNALLELAEIMVDNGLAGDPILVALGEVRGLRDDIARLGTKIMELEDRELRIEQSARQREGSLRFAIGELSFDMTRVDSQLASDLKFQVEQLETRMAELLESTEKELEVITDERIAAAASEAKLFDELTAANGRLRAAVAERLNPRAVTPETLPLVSRFQAIEASLAQMAGLDHM